MSVTMKTPTKASPKIMRGSQTAVFFAMGAEVGVVASRKIRGRFDLAYYVFRIAYLFFGTDV